VHRGVIIKKSVFRKIDLVGKRRRDRGALDDSKSIMIAKKWYDHLALATVVLLFSERTLVLICIHAEGSCAQYCGISISGHKACESMGWLYERRTA
jgi:hypothetical protein